MDDKKQEIIPPTIQETDEMWKRLVVQIRNHEREKRRKRIIGAISGLAALVMLIGGLMTYRSYTSPDVYMANSSNRTIILADHSVVTLLKGAKLTVEKSFPSNTRDVYLQGDAIFKVTKSKEHPFIVHGNGYETKVLGTVFKVSQKGNNFKVDLYEGSVLVYKAGNSKDYLALKPQQSFNNFGTKGVASISSIQKINNGVPTIATLVFTEVPLRDVIETLERAYQVKILYNEDIESKITITQKNSTVNEFLEALSIQLNITNRQINANTFELEK